MNTGLDALKAFRRSVRHALTGSRVKNTVLAAALGSGSVELLDPTLKTAGGLPAGGVLALAIGALMLTANVAYGLLKPQTLKGN
jgi:hypothetical protein